MGRKLTDATRAKAIVNDAWDTVKLREATPKWNYIGVVAIVDVMLADDPERDGRDISDALVLCAELGDTPTAWKLIENVKRIQRGRLGTGGWK